MQGGSFGPRRDGEAPGVRRRTDMYVGPYTLRQTIGKGLSGQTKVKLAVHQRTGHECAMKIVSKELMRRNHEIGERVEREIKVLKLLRHPFLVRSEDVMQTATHYFIVLELAQRGELYQYVLDHEAISTHQCFQFFYQIVCGVQYMHSQRICHRDVKLETILLDAELNVKITGFAMVCAMPKGKLLKMRCGSPHYVCPEIVLGVPYHGELADAWSIGVVLFTIARGTLPFEDEDNDRLYGLITAGRFELSDQVEQNLCSVIRGLLTVEPEQRLTLDAVTQHPFWTDNRRRLAESATEEYHLRRSQDLIMPPAGAPQ